MNRIFKPLGLTVLLAAMPSVALAYKPIACSACDCRTACTTVCTRPDGTPDICLRTGWCEGMPVCYGRTQAETSTGDLESFLASLGEAGAQPAQSWR
jgi:hypothetical protein